MFIFLWWYHYPGEKFKNPCARLKLRQLKISISSWPIYLNLNLKITLKCFADKFRQYKQPLERAHFLQRDYFCHFLFFTNCFLYPVRFHLHCFHIPSMLHFTLLSSFYLLIVCSNLLIGSLKSYSYVINNAQVWGGMF